MKNMSAFSKLLKNRNLSMILAILAFLGVIIFLYNSQKGKSLAPHTPLSYSFVNNNNPTNTLQTNLEQTPIAVNVQNREVPQTNNNGNFNPSELLPPDNNRDFGANNPVGNGVGANINMLNAGFHHGIDTVGSTLRNANLQLRSEPANPRAAVSPWLQSTIEPDTLRRVLEIGTSTNFTNI
jgi:hypothetical protein